MPSPIPLALYTRVCTALAAGIPLEEVLSVCGMLEDVWLKQQEIWGETIGEKLGEDAAFQAEYDHELVMARTLIRRSIEPIESDRVSWLKFISAWMTSSSPEEFLMATGLTSQDFFRLQQKWSEYFYSHPEEQLLSLPQSGVPLVCPALTIGLWQVEPAFAEFRDVMGDFRAEEEEEPDDEDDVPVDPEKPALFAALPTLEDLAEEARMLPGQGYR